MNLDDMQIFVKVVEAGSFTSAAKLLKIPKSTLSRRITFLESCLSVRLMQRTTRSLKLTALGQDYYQQATLIIAAAEEANQSVQASNQQPQGRLRISVPLEMAQQQLAEMLDNFLKLYPQISLELDISDNLVNLVEDGYDLVIRAGKLEDSTLIAKKLKDIDLNLYASKNYLESKSHPLTPYDLMKHNCILFNGNNRLNNWKLFHNKESVIVPIKSRYSVNNVSILLKWMLADSGIAILPASTAQKYIEQDRLQPILPCWNAGQISIYMIYPSRKFLPAKVKVLMEYLSTWFSTST